MSGSLPPLLRSRDYLDASGTDAQLRQLHRTIDDLRRRHREAQTRLTRILDEVLVIREHIQTKDRGIAESSKDTDKDVRDQDIEMKSLSEVHTNTSHQRSRATDPLPIPSRPELRTAATPNPHDP